MDLDSLPERLSDQQLDQVVAIADGPLPAAPVASDDFVLRCLKTMLSVLPRQKMDAEAGELFVETYLRFMRDLPKDQIAYMARTAVETCEWFPTISRCQSILRTWQRHDGDTRRRQQARQIMERERTARREAFYQRLAAGEISQERIDALPQPIIWEGRKRNILRWDGKRFVVKDAEDE